MSNEISGRSKDMDDDNNKNPSPTYSSVSTIATFPVKLYSILSDPRHSDIISWMPHGKAWKVLKPKVLIEEVIPQYFSHMTKYESFMRQVNGWGFKRISFGPDRNCYYHILFVRDNPDAVQTMKRRKRRRGGSRDQDDDWSDDNGPTFYDIYGLRSSNISNTNIGQHVIRNITHQPHHITPNQPPYPPLQPHLQPPYPPPQQHPQDLGPPSNYTLQPRHSPPVRRGGLPAHVPHSYYQRHIHSQHYPPQLHSSYQTQNQYPYQNEPQDQNRYQPQGPRIPYQYQNATPTSPNRYPPQPYGPFPTQQTTNVGRQMDPPFVPDIGSHSYQHGYYPQSYSNVQGPPDSAPRVSLLSEESSIQANIRPIPIHDATGTLIERPSNEDSSHIFAHSGSADDFVSNFPSSDSWNESPPSP